MRYHTRSGFAIAAFFLFQLACVAPAAAIVVRPAFLDIEVRPGQHQTGVITVTNSSDAEDRFRVSVSHFRLSVEGEMREAAPDSFAVSDWMKFNPREFALAPNAEQQVRYTLVVPAGTKVGDYWGVLQFMPLTAQTVEARSAEGDQNVKLSVTTAVVVPIFAQVGQVKYEWLIADLEASGDAPQAEVAVTLRNNGNGRVPFRTEVDVTNSAGDIVARAERGEISLFPFSERIVRLPLESVLDPGEYTVRARISSEKAGATQAGETSLHVAPRP